MYEGLESYLSHAIETGLKISTFNRCSAGVKHFLINVLGQVETEQNKERIALLH